MALHRFFGLKSTLTSKNHSNRHITHICMYIKLGKAAFHHHGAELDPCQRGVGRIDNPVSRHSSGAEVRNTAPGRFLS